MHQIISLETFLFIFLLPFINSFLSHPLNKYHTRVYNGGLPHRVNVSLLYKSCDRSCGNLLVVSSILHLTWQVKCICKKLLLTTELIM